MIFDKSKQCAEAIISLLFLLVLFTSPDFAGAPAPVPGENTAGTADNSAVNNDCARLIAGMFVEQGPFSRLQSRQAWVEYARFFDQSWQKLDEKQLTPVRQWAERELGAAASSGNTVFYPCSGPDFANVHAFFPQARTYVLVGLEPLGEVPDFAAMKDAQFDSYLAGMKKSLVDLLNFHYFVSAHMKAEFHETEVKGVLPILLFMVARNNARVIDFRYWTIKPDGTVQDFPALRAADLDPAAVQGVRITFEVPGEQESRTRTLYYFRLNLYNHIFEQNRYFLSFLKGLGLLPLL